MSVTAAASDTSARLRSAVRSAVSRYGLSSTTLTAVAEEAGVSRMTVYRRFGSVERLVLDALTEDVEAFELPKAPSPLGVEVIASIVQSALSQLVRNDLFKAVVQESPTALMPYAVERFGGVQKLLSAWLIRLIAQGQRDGSVKAGDPEVLASALLVALQGFALARNPSAELFDEAWSITVGYLTREKTA